MKEIAVISGKGGTGKSSISAAFASIGGNVVFADCDVDAANLYLIFYPDNDEEEVYIGGEKAVIDYSLCTNCGICTEKCRFDAILFQNGKTVISDISCDGCRLCERICPVQAIHMEKQDKSRMYSGSFRNGKMVYGRLAPGKENSGKLVNKVREKAKQIASKENIHVIIIDGPPGIGCPVISSITGVDAAVIVTEPTISGISDLKRTLDVTSKFQLKTWVLINKSDLNKDMSSRIERLCEDLGVAVAGKLPFDIQIVEAMVNKKSIVEFNKDSEIVKILEKVYKKIIVV